MGRPRVLQSYIDANCARDLDQRRFTIGYVFTVTECVISWKAKLQYTVALSTLEVSTYLQLRHQRKLCG